MRIGQSAILALDDQRSPGQRQQGAYAVQRHTGVEGLGRGSGLHIGGDIGDVAGIRVLKGHLTFRIGIVDRIIKIPIVCCLELHPIC